MFVAFCSFFTVLRAHIRFLLLLLSIHLKKCYYPHSLLLLPSSLAVNALPLENVRSLNLRVLGKELTSPRVHSPPLNARLLL